MLTVCLDILLPNKPLIKKPINGKTGTNHIYLIMACSLPLHDIEFINIYGAFITENDI